MRSTSRLLPASILALLALALARPVAAGEPQPDAVLAELDALQASASANAARCSEDAPRLEALLSGYRGRTGFFPGETAAIRETSARVAEGTAPYVAAFGEVSARVDALKATEARTRGGEWSGATPHRTRFQRLLDVQRTAWELEACVRTLSHLAEAGRALASLASSS